MVPKSNKNSITATGQEGEIVQPQREAFYMYRNVSKCISRGISLITDNFLYLIRVMLPVSIPLTLILTASVFIHTDYAIYSHIDTSDSIPYKAAVNGLLLIAVMMYIVFGGVTYRLIYSYAKGDDISCITLHRLYKTSSPFISKLAVISVLAFIPTIIVSAMSAYLLSHPSVYPTMRIIQICSIPVAAIIVWALVLPVQMAIPNSMLSGGKFRANLIDGYKQGLRTWGKQFGLSFLTSLLLAVIYLLLLTPSIAMVLIHAGATQGLAEGDPVDIPSGYNVLYLCTLTLSIYIIITISMLQYTPAAFLYASIEHDEQQQMLAEIPENEFIKFK